MKKFTPLSVREVRWMREREMWVKCRTLTILSVSGTRGDDRESESADRIPAAALRHSSRGDRLQRLKVRLRTAATRSSARHPPTSTWNWAIIRVSCRRLSVVNHSLHDLSMIVCLRLPDSSVLCNLVFTQSCVFSKLHRLMCVVQFCCGNAEVDFSRGFHSVKVFSVCL